VLRWDPRRALVTSIAVASLVGIVLAALRGPLAGTGNALWPLSWLAWPVAGWMVLVRRPGNRIGQFCLGIGASMGLAFGLQSIVLDVGPTVGVWIELAYTVLGVVPFLLIVAVLNTFPTGSYAGRAEAIVGRALIAVGSWALLGFLIRPGPLYDTGLNNPLALPQLSGLAVVTNDSGFFLVVLLALGALARLFVRARRSSGIERQQFRWLLFGGALFVVISGAGQFLPEDSAGNFIWLLGGSSIPASVGVAVIRYRLYEIDRIVSKTFTYAVVVVALGALYAGLVVALRGLLPLEGDLPVAMSTLVVAWAFFPFVRRVQRVVDRRFFRSHYDAGEVVSRLAADLQGSLNLSDVTARAKAMVGEVLAPITVGVWVAEEATNHPA
jgi:hypothetical protein